MNHTYEVESLAAETLALQAVVIAIFGRLASANPGLRRRLVWDLMTLQTMSNTIKLGNKASPAHTSKALQIVEGLRSTTLGNASDPKHRV